MVIRQVANCMDSSAQEQRNEKKEGASIINAIDEKNFNYVYLRANAQEFHTQSTVLQTSFKTQISALLKGLNFQVTCKHCKPIPCNENTVFPVYFFSQGNPCNGNRVPAMRIEVPCNENRFFPVRKSTQGKPCSGPVLALYWIAV